MTSKRRITFLTTGLLFIAAALILTIYNLYDNYRAGQTANSIVASLSQIRDFSASQIPWDSIPLDNQDYAEDVIHILDGPMPVRDVNGYDYIATLTIPAYELELPVISQWSYPNLKVAPCRYTGSAYSDDLVISAHNYRSHFGLIVELNPGEQVHLTDMLGNTFVYEVVLQETLEATAVEEMTSGDWDLTMFTCTVGGQSRVAVRCKRISEIRLSRPVETLTENISGAYTVGNPVQEKRQDIPEETTSTEEITTDPARTGWNGIPLYFQTDFPNTMYGSGTIKSSGCSVTSLAMVATYLTGHEYLPDELARYFGGRAINNIARLEKGSKTLQLPFYKSENWDYTYADLQQGKIAIALMESNSYFTDSQHFIVLAGLTENGRILVNDPYEPNYDNWLLREGFANGFSPADILRGYSGAWIYDISKMPEEPFIYYEAPMDRSNARYPEIELTYEERKLLAEVVWAEARGESDEGQQAVAEVVLNRLASDDFPNTLHDVIYGEGQFRSVSVLDKAEPYQAQYDAIERAMYGPYVLPEDVYYFATFAVNDNVWGEIGGHIFCYAPKNP